MQLRVRIYIHAEAPPLIVCHHFDSTIGEKINPSEIAYDRPSKMLRPFLERNLGLVGGIDMPNRFMVSIYH